MSCYARLILARGLCHVLDERERQNLDKFD